MDFIEDIMNAFIDAEFQRKLQETRNEIEKF